MSGKLGRVFLYLVPCTLCLGYCCALAQQYPSRPIRMIVPYPPGGSTDPTGRAYAGWLSEALGQQVVVDNRPGAGSTIGHGLGAKATPDGYNILLGTSGELATAPALGVKVPYDPVRDFVPIGLGVYAPFLLAIHPALPASTPFWRRPHKMLSAGGNTISRSIAAA